MEGEGRRPLELATEDVEVLAVDRGAVAEAAGGLLILGLGARPEVRLEVERVQVVERDAALVAAAVEVNDTTALDL